MFLLLRPSWITHDLLVTRLMLYHRACSATTTVGQSFFIRSSVFGPETLGCWKSDPSSWSKIFTNIPDDASEINGVNYPATVTP